MLIVNVHQMFHLHSYRILFRHVEHLGTYLEMLIIFPRVNVYLNKPIEVDELIKFAN